MFSSQHSSLPPFTAHPAQPLTTSARLPSPDPTSAPRPSPQMLMLLAAVKQARLYAVAAVNADLAGDYAAAAANYRAAVKSLKNEVANVPPEDTQAFTDRIVMYERRAEMIELHKLGTAAIEGTLPVEDTKLPTVRPCKDPFPEPIPEGDAARTFWLFRVLTKTLTTGGFVAPRVYVPRDVWYGQLPNVRLEHLQLKCGVCFQILDALQKLQQVANYRDSTLAAAELQRFCETLNTLQLILAEKITYVPRPATTVDERVLKQVKRVVEKDSSDDVKKYAQALTNLMKESLFLEGWVSHYADVVSAAQVNTLLGTVLTFFQNIFCVIVLSDLRTLLSKYMHRFESQMLATL